MNSLERNLRLLLVFLVLWMLVLFLSLVFRFLNVGLEKQTKELCAIYAEQDHSKEIAETRRQWLLENGYDYNNDFDWYESCIKHSSNY